MLLKICGMCDADNIRAVEAAARPDMMGFIFWPASSRYCHTLPAYMPGVGVERVGVFVDAQTDDIVARAKAFGLHRLQLHGHECPDRCCEVHEATGLPVIKALRVETTADVAHARYYANAVSMILFDTRTSLPGGSGRQFDWSILSAYDVELPFLLSGGIGPDDINALTTFQHPRCAGFDVNSRFEFSPGIKDANALAAFASAMRQPLNIEH